MIMLTGASSHWRLYAFSLLIRSNILKISSFYVEITSALGSTAYMVFMTNAAAVSVSSFGRLSATPLTASLVVLSLTTRLFACMEG